MPSDAQQIADSYARRVEQEDQGWASQNELLARLRESNPAMSEAVLQAYVRHGTRRRDDGRIVWKRDPNLVKGFVPTDLWPFVKQIESPILYVLGCRSTIVSPATQDMLRARLPQVRIVTMPGLGHYPSDEQPTQFTAIVERFLDGSE